MLSFGLLSSIFSCTVKLFSNERYSLNNNNNNNNCRVVRMSGVESLKESIDIVGWNAGEFLLALGMNIIPKGSL